MNSLKFESSAHQEELEMLHIENAGLKHEL